MTELATLKWGVERRLEFIEFRLFWEGGVNRSDIIDRFDVSVPQASKDLTLYQERAPLNARYDKSARRYVAGEGFTPVFLRPDSDAYLTQLRLQAEGLVASGESWLSSPPLTDVALTPHRAVDGQVLRSVLAALRDGRSVRVLYQSMNSTRPEPTWRTISPHAFGHDSFRWHVRAWCQTERVFKDFLLPRILEVGDFSVGDASGQQDILWQTMFDLAIVPHPGLSPAQKTVVERDYGMIGGRAVLPVRMAMLFYVLRRLGLLDQAELKDPRIQHIVAEDPAAVTAARHRADGEPALHRTGHAIRP